MTPLINQLFPERQVPHIQELTKDKDLKKLVYDEIKKQLTVGNKIVLGQELNQLVLILSQADFAESEEESVGVVVMLMSGFRSSEILPSLEKHRGMEFSSKCLISLSFFRERMHFLCKRYAAPHPDLRIAGFGRDDRLRLAAGRLRRHRWRSYRSARLVHRQLYVHRDHVRAQLRVRLGRGSDLSVSRGQPERGLARG